MFMFNYIHLWGPVCFFNWCIHVMIKCVHPCHLKYCALWFSFKFINPVCFFFFIFHMLFFVLYPGSYCQVQYCEAPSTCFPSKSLRSYVCMSSAHFLCWVLYMMFSTIPTLLFPKCVSSFLKVEGLVLSCVPLPFFAKDNSITHCRVDFGVLYLTPLVHISAFMLTSEIRKC